MDHSKNGFTEEEVRQLKETFYAQSSELMELLVHQILELEQTPTDETCLREIQRVIHTLKGDSRSIGIPLLANFLHHIEDALVPITEKHRQVDRKIIELLFQGSDVIQEILQASLKGEEESVDVTSILEQFNQYKFHRNTQSSTHRIPLTEYARLQLDSARKEGSSIYEIILKFDPRCLGKGPGAILVTKNLSEMGEIVFLNPSLDSAALEQSPHLTLLFVARASIQRIEEGCKVAGVVLEAKINPYPKSGQIVDRRLSGDRRAGSKSSADSIIRVDSQRVDEMMNLIGELMISRSTVSQYSSELEDCYPDNETVMQLQSANTIMERTLSDLQKSVMKVRMVPVDQVFRKFPRVVRDLSQENGKQIALEIAGKETELDKSLVDVLSEPILHLVRNAIDHGMEMPQARTSFGKPAGGKITLKAYHEANQVVIQVQDDGRGIDREKIKQKVLEKELMDEKDLRKMTDREILDLIFLPGLSTAEKVTEVSGRGIGMNVVKTTIEKLKGVIEIHSEPSKGTTFTLRLPLTLAIIKAIMFEVGKRLFAIPVSSIVEITRASSDFETIHNKPVFRLRDRVISLIRLGELFEIQSPVKSNRRIFIILLALAEKRIGLVVDKIVGEEELVIKPLEDQCISSKSVSGASILGNGKVVLILDVQSVIHQAIIHEREETAVSVGSNSPDLRGNHDG